jgi:hypothetical protein
MLIESYICTAFQHFVFDNFDLADGAGFTGCVCFFMQSASLYFDRNSDGKIYIYIYRERERERERESCWYTKVQPDDFHLNHGATWRWTTYAKTRQLYPPVKNIGAHWIGGCLGARGGVEVLEKWKMLCHYLDSIYGPSSPVRKWPKRLQCMSKAFCM